MIVRDATPADDDAVRLVNKAAFGRPDEAALVEQLVGIVSPCVNLVADLVGAIRGHILFTAVEVDCEDGTRWSAMGLGPMAVTPEHQREGIGTALIKEGITRCAADDCPAVFVLGHPEYYPRFGFEPASTIDCRTKWDVPDGVFMVHVLDETKVRGGLVRYHKAFDSLT